MLALLREKLIKQMWIFTTNTGIPYARARRTILNYTSYILFTTTSPDTSALMLKNTPLLLEKYVLFRTTLAHTFRLSQYTRLPTVSVFAGHIQR